MRPTTYGVTSVQKALQLDEAERLRFMRALYSVFFRDQQINAVERGVLNTLNALFKLKTGDYQHYVHGNAAEIAHELNGIADVRVRIYFMRIVHDVYRREIMDWLRGPESGHAVKLRAIYSDLQRLVEVT